MSILDDLRKGNAQVKKVLDGDDTIVPEENTEESSELKKFTPLGKDVVDQFDVVIMPEILITKKTVNKIDYKGGYNQKTFRIKGNSINTSSVFDLTNLAAGSNQIKILGLQLLQTVKFSPVTINSWIARWKLNGGAISIDLMDSSSDVLNLVGSKADIFFDANTNSDLTIGNNYIEIELWNSGDTPEKADNTDGEIVGIIHYIEMLDMKLEL